MIRACLTLRATARVDAELFREILAFAKGRYDQDKATYHVSGKVEKVPNADDPAETELEGILDQFDARQVFHVTYGSVLTAKNPDGK